MEDEEYTIEQLSKHADTSIGIVYGGAIQEPLLAESEVDSFRRGFDTAADYGFKYEVESLRRIDVSFMTMFTDYLLQTPDNPLHVKGFIEALFDVINRSQEEHNPDLDAKNLVQEMLFRIQHNQGIQVNDLMMLNHIGEAYRMLEHNLIEQGVVFLDTVIVGWEDGYGLVIGEG